MGPGNERGNELEASIAEQFPHLGNYTLTPGFSVYDIDWADTVELAEEHHRQKYMNDNK